MYFGVGAAVQPPAGVRRPNTRTIIAQPGYVVGGMPVDADETNAVALRVTFVWMKAPKVTYTSSWLGVPSRIHQELLGGMGERINGVFGHKGLNLDAVGLLLDSGEHKTEQIGGDGGSPFAFRSRSAAVVGFLWAEGSWDGHPVLDAT